jgi:hypothetical protein
MALDYNKANLLSPIHNPEKVDIYV